MSPFRNTVLGAEPGYADLPLGVGADDPYGDIDLLGRALGRLVV